MISRQTDSVIAWCENNVSSRCFYIKTGSGIKIGGEGWTIVIDGWGTNVDIKDEKLKTMFLLVYGRLGATKQV